MARTTCCWALGRRLTRSSWRWSDCTTRGACGGPSPLACHVDDGARAALRAAARVHTYDAALFRSENHARAVATTYADRGPKVHRWASAVKSMTDNRRA